MSTSTSEPDIESLCSTCFGMRAHEVLARVRKRHDDQDVWLIEDFFLLRCRGCDTHSCRRDSTFSEDFDSEGNYDTQTEVLPGVPSRKPREGFELPYALERMYEEVMKAFNSGSYLLCAIGLRALVEGICEDLGVKKGPVQKPDGTIAQQKNIEGKINGLLEKGIAGKVETEALHGIRFMGNDAVHELARPSKAEAELVLDIVEHMMELSYSISGKAAQIKRLRDRRKAPVPAEEDED